MVAKNRRGLALLNVLMVVTVVFLFCFSITNLAIFHYQAACRQEQALRALEAAQSGLSEAVRQLSVDPTFGSTPKSVVGDIGGGHYEVHFAGAQPVSTNNLDGFLPRSGHQGRPVPPHSAHLLVVGTTAGGGHRTLEAVVHLEALPFPVQSSGKVVGHSLTVAGALSAQHYKSDPKKLPGSVYAGASGVDSVSLDGIGEVTGDVRTPGEVRLAPTVMVAGTTSAGAAALEVPDLNIANFDNSMTAGVKVVAGGNYGPLNPLGGGAALHLLQGLIYVDGSLNLSGPVLLENAYVYVGNGGNLSIDGPITGKGSLFVTGKTSLQSAAMIHDDDQIAIFSQGDLEVDNQSLPLLSVFQGVLYSHSNIRLSVGVNVLGAVIARSNEASLGCLHFEGLNQIVHVPEHTAFASYWLAKGAGGVPVKLDYWAELP